MTQLAQTTETHAEPSMAAATPQRKGRKRLMQVISALVTVALMAYILLNVQWATLGELLASVSLLSIAAAFGTYMLLQVFRAWRFKALLEKRQTPYRLLIPITFYHNFLVRVLPFKMGELSYIILLRNRLGYSVEEGVSSLVAARLLELIVIIFVMGVALLASGAQLAQQREVLLLLSVVGFVVCALGMYFASNLMRWGLGIGRRIMDALLGERVPGFVDKLEAALHKLADEFAALQRPALFSKALFITLFTYGGSFFTFYILLLAVGVEVSTPTMIAIISLGMFASAFPFSISGFGVIELSWAAGLIVLANYTTAEASAVGLLLHAFQIISATIIGALGYLAIQAQPERTLSEA